MKRAALVGAALALLAAPAFAPLAFAQATAPRTTDTPAAVASPSNINKTTMAPVAGKNSFTQDQAVKRLQDHGYTTITGLVKDDQSVWHGKAVMSGKSMDVTVDYQGNITAN